LSIVCIGTKTILHCGKLIEPQKLQIINEISIIIEGNKIVDVQKGYIKADLSDKVIDLKTKLYYLVYLIAMYI
jgi:imidazolonepropionase-like amidohydrolase